MKRAVCAFNCGGPNVEPRLPTIRRSSVSRDDRWSACNALTEEYVMNFVCLNRVAETLRHGQW